MKLRYRMQQLTRPHMLDLLATGAMGFALLAACLDVTFRQGDAVVALIVSGIVASVVFLGVPRLVYVLLWIFDR